MIVRAAGPDDVGAVADLEQQALGDDAWSPALVEAGVLGDLPTVLYLVAEDDATGAVLGHAVASAVPEVAELQRIAVDAGARRRGVASALLDEVVRRTRAAGADRLLLEVREDNHGALLFYAARGFTEIDRRRRYYRDGATAVVLRRALGGGCG